MLTPCSAALSLLALALPAPAQDVCGCHATNARYNVLDKPKTGYDFIPIVADDSLGFYVAYSAKQNADNTGFNSTSCMYVLPLEGDDVLVFGGGFGDTYYIPGGAYFDADHDAAFIREIVGGCMGRDPAAARIRFVAPHGHPDHITVAVVKALERAGLAVAEIAYHEGDSDWIEQLPWLAHHPALFNVLAGGDCNEEVLSYASPLGRVWFTHRAGHTPGSIDMVLDVLGNPGDRVHVLGSYIGGCPAPGGVSLTLAAHGTAMIGGPRRAQTEVMNGTGKNRLCLSGATPPKLGTSWVTEVDVAGHPGASFVLLFGTDCGLDPGVLLSFGELLVNPLGRSQLNAQQAVLAGDTSTFSFPIPSDASLMGRTCYAQSTILGGKVELCNALKLVIGF